MLWLPTLSRGKCSAQEGKTSEWTAIALDQACIQELIRMDQSWSQAEFLVHACIETIHCYFARSINKKWLGSWSNHRRSYSVPRACQSLAMHAKRLLLSLCFHVFPCASLSSNWERCNSIPKSYSSNSITLGCVFRSPNLGLWKGIQWKDSLFGSLLESLLRGPNLETLKKDPRVTSQSKEPRERIEGHHQLTASTFRSALEADPTSEQLASRFRILHLLKNK